MNSEYDNNAAGISSSNLVKQTSDLASMLIA